MMASARQVILAADHTKLDRVAFANIGFLKELDCLVTDARPDRRWLEALDNNGVRLITP